jgi:macrolide transport system ATP-binding/permease protein
MSVNESSVESPRWPLSYSDYLDWQRLNKSFSSLDVYSGTGYILRSSSGAEPVQAERVSGSFFQTLGVRPCSAAISMPMRTGRAARTFCY